MSLCLSEGEYDSYSASDRQGLIQKRFRIAKANKAVNLSCKNSNDDQECS